MGRKSREHRERREKRHSPESNKPARLEEELRRMKDEDFLVWTSKDCPSKLRESELEDIIAFESVETGTSLFDGLQEHGIELPHPDELNEAQSAAKIREVQLALMELQVLLVGFDLISPRQAYQRLWNQTLWEGCYVKKKTPGSLTIMDVSRRMPRPEIEKILRKTMGSDWIH